MTAKDLKNALLQEAVQGKLVPQIASEGNARDLLEEIRKEKLSHGLDFANAKSGKRKSKKETALAGSNPCDISEEEIPFEIPENWCWCRLGEIASKITDGEHKTPNRTNEYCGFYLLSARNILNGKISLDKVDYVDSNEFERIKKRCNPVKGDILISCSGSVGRSAVIIDENNYVMVRSAAMVKPIINNSFFLMFCIQSPCLQTQIQDSIKQAVQANLFQEAIRNLLIPLPPLAEQKRIVAAIEKFMPLIEEYGKKETELKAFNEQIGTLTKKAILQEAVQGKLVPQIAAEGNAKYLLDEIRKEKAKLVKEGNLKKEKTLPEITEEDIPFDIPGNWCWCRLGEICTKLVDGDHNPPAGISEKTEYIMASSRNINNDKLVDLDLVRYLSKEVFEKENERTNAQEGDIFFTGVGTLGRSCIYDGKLNICFQRSVSVLHTVIYNRYLKYCLDNPVIQDFIISNSTGTAQKGFYLNQLAELLIPLPPLAEQKRIVAAIEKLLPLCEKLGV